VKPVSLGFVLKLWDAIRGFLSWLQSITSGVLERSLGMEEEGKDYIIIFCFYSDTYAK
jgi:hypothetical protein